MSLIVKEVLENEALVGEAQDKLIENGLYKASDMFDKYYSSLFNYNAFGKINKRRLRTTNIMERLNEELKRRTGKIGAFPLEASLMVLTIMMDINEDWNTERKYINVDVDKDCTGR